MKIRLPKVLKCAVLLAMAAGVGHAAILTPVDSVTSGAIVTNTTPASSYVVVTKDGADTATVTGSVTTNTAMFVREGTIEVGDGETSTTWTISPKSGGSTMLQVSGKDSHVVVNKATLQISDERDIVVGGADGNGTLTLEGGSQAFGYRAAYLIIGSPANHESGDSNATAGSDGRYVGSYTEAANGSGDVFGKGVVNVTEGSALTVGMAGGMYMYEGELNADGAGTTVTIGTLASTYAFMGTANNCTSEINVTGGASMTVNASLYTNYVTNGTSIITVGGYAEDGTTRSTFTMSATCSTATEAMSPNSLINKPVSAYLGYAWYVESYTELNVEAGGLVKLNGTTEVGNSYGLDKVAINIKEDGILESKGSYRVYLTDTTDENAGEVRNPIISMNENTVLNNKGTLDADDLRLWGGAVVNNEGLAKLRALKHNSGEFNNDGQLTADTVVMQSPAVFNNTGSATVGVLETSGIINNTGTLVVSQLLVYDYAKLNITIGSEAGAPITVTGSSEYAFYMGSNSVLGLNFTEEYLENAMPVDGSNRFSFNEKVVSTSTGGFVLGTLVYELAGMDNRFWSLEDATFSYDATAGYVQGTVVYNPWYDVAEDELTESLADTSDSLKVGLVISEKDVVISGDNSYSGGTIIEGKKLTVAHERALGTGDVVLKSHGELDLNHHAVTNAIYVEGCTLSGADHYNGLLHVSGNLNLTGRTTAQAVCLAGGSISGASLETGELVVQSGTEGNVTTDLTIHDNGTITLNDGHVLAVTGSLTLGNGVKLTLNGDYAAGTALLSSTGTLTLAGDVTLEYADGTVELAQQGNSIVLVRKYNQDKANASSLSNWGIATASRAVVNAVRGQRNNTGCIANGRGTAWVAVLGASQDINGSDIELDGSAVGADFVVGQRSRLGFALGYTEADVKPAGMSKVEQEGSYLALYGEHGLKKLGATSCLSMDWVAAYGTTESKDGAATWEQDSLQLNTRLNWNKKMTDRLCMSVFGGLEYFATESDTVEGIKSGSIQNLRGEVGVGARFVAWGTPAAADGKSGLVMSRGCEKLVLHGELRYMNDMVRSNPVIRMNGHGGVGMNPGRQGMGVEAGATYRMGERWSASANYGFNTMDDAKEHRVNVGASYTF